MADETIDEAAPAKGKAKAAAAEPTAEPAAALKPYGMNVGDVVDGAHARGGQYEAIGAGKYRRIA